MHHILKSGVNLNALNTRKMPPTRASNLYSTFPLNPTRLPVTSDTARQKLSFTAHGQHRGQKTKYNGPTHPHFFPSEQQILNSKMTRQSSLKRLPEKQKLSKAAELKQEKQSACACQGEDPSDSRAQRSHSQHRELGGRCTWQQNKLARPEGCRGGPAPEAALA